MKVIAHRYSTIIYWTKFPWVSHFLKKSDFHLSNGVFPIFCYMKFQRRHWLEDFAWNLRGRRDTKIQVIEVSVSSLYYLFSVLYPNNRIKERLYKITWTHLRILHSNIQNDEERRYIEASEIQNQPEDIMNGCVGRTIFI
jgi:hypothetical protein